MKEIKDTLVLLGLSILAAALLLGGGTALYADETAAHYRWTRGEHGWALMDGRGQQVGYVQDTGEFFPFTVATGAWGAACEPPIERPEGCYLTGVVSSKLWRHRDRITVHGGDAKEVSEEEAIRMIQGGQHVAPNGLLVGDPNVPDDGNKLSLTLIDADDAKRKQFLDDLAQAPALAPFRGAYKVQAYAPTDPMIAGFGWTAGDVYLQKNDGTVLMTPAPYQGPEQLAGALRVADPAYSDSKVPQPGGVKLSLGGVPPHLYVLGATCTALAVFGGSRRKSSPAA
jgi:hypothetical protein